MNILKYIGYLMLSSLVIKLLFTNAVVQVVIVVLVFIISMYYLVKKEIFWKIYTYVYCAMIITYFLDTTNEGYTLYDYIWIPLGILSIVGLFGIAYKKAIFNRFIWMLLLFANVIDLILPYNDSTSIFEEIDEFGFAEGTIFLLFIAYMTIPMVVGLFQYAFYCDDIWKDDKIIVHPEL